MTEKEDTDLLMSGLDDAPEQDEGPGASTTEGAASACEAGRLSSITGWPWTARETASLNALPRQSTVGHREWRQSLAERLGGQDRVVQREMRSTVDRHTARMREVTRIIRTLEREGSPPVSDARRSYDQCRVVVGRMRPFDELAAARGDDGRLEADIGLCPPDLRLSFIRALEIISDRWCHEERQPDCASCPVSLFCQHYRSEIWEARIGSGAPTALDLFSGCGGLSLGFGSAGFRSVCAVDNDEDATVTYALNFPEVSADRIICGDITSETVHSRVTASLNSRSPDVIIGGPPCQGFSKAGERARTALRSRSGINGFRPEDDQRNYLFEELIDLTEVLRPKVVLMENVPGMDAARRNGLSFMGLAREMLKQLGYATAVWQIDAASYGVPQHRIRSFLVGSLAPVAPAFPEPEFRGSTRAPSHQDDLLPPVTLNQAISDLPPVAAGAGSEVAPAEFLLPDDSPVLRHLLKVRRFPLRRSKPVIYNHRARWNNSSDLDLYGMLREGEDAHDIVTRYRRPDLMKYRKDIFHDKYFRLRGNAPSRTIVSHLGNDGNGYIHPTQTRSITRREGARIQTFPDDFIFCGSQQSQWRQIGNAVPPLLALSLGRVIRRHLERFF